MVATIRDLTIDHLGDEATEVDLAQFIAAVRRILPAFDSEEEAIEFIWGQGDFFARVHGDRSLTADDVADQLGITARRVRQLAQQGGVGWNTGRDWIFRPADLEILRSRQTRRGPRPRSNGE